VLDIFGGAERRMPTTQSEKSPQHPIKQLLQALWVLALKLVQLEGFGAG